MAGNSSGDPVFGGRGPGPDLADPDKQALVPGQADDAGGAQSAAARLLLASQPTSTSCRRSARPSPPAIRPASRGWAFRSWRNPTPAWAWPGSTASARKGGTALPSGLALAATWDVKHRLCRQRRHRPGRARQRPECAAGRRRRSDARAAQRPQFRISGRGPAAGRHAGGRDHPRHPGPACDVHRQALRPERAGDRSATRSAPTSRKRRRGKAICWPSRSPSSAAIPAR